MEERFEEFRKVSEKAKAAGGRIRYSKEMRSFAVEFAKNRIGSGGTISSSARELGVAEVTLGRWLKKSGDFREVRIRPPAGNAGAVTIVTPGGYRVEGLDIEGATFVLRAIG
jgi:transposase-like protein